MKFYEYHNAHDIIITGQTKLRQRFRIFFIYLQYIINK